MIKSISFLFCSLLFLVSCAHNNLDDHFQKSMTGWTKSQVIQKFGAPNETSEDSNYDYYFYNTKSSKKPIRIWQIKYVFEHNNLIRVEKSLKPTEEETDRLEKHESSK